MFSGCVRWEWGWSNRKFPKFWLVRFSWETDKLSQKFLSEKYISNREKPVRGWMVQPMKKIKCNVEMAHSVMVLVMDGIVVLTVVEELNALQNFHYYVKQEAYVMMVLVIVVLQLQVVAHNKVDCEFAVIVNFFKYCKHKLLTVTVLSKFQNVK